MTHVIRVSESCETNGCAEAPIERRKSGGGKDIAAANFGVDAEIFERKFSEHSDQLRARITFGADAFHVMPEDPTETFPRTAAKERVFDPLAYGVNAVNVVDHDLYFAARFDHANQFRNGLFSVRGTVKHAKGIAQIKAVILERKILRVAHAD